MAEGEYNPEKIGSEKNKDELPVKITYDKKETVPQPLRRDVGYGVRGDATTQTGNKEVIQTPTPRESLGRKLGRLLRRFSK